MILVTRARNCRVVAWVSSPEIACLFCALSVQDMATLRTPQRGQPRITPPPHRQSKSPELWEYEEDGTSYDASEETSCHQEKEDEGGEPDLEEEEEDESDDGHPYDCTGLEDYLEPTSTTPKRIFWIPVGDKDGKDAKTQRHVFKVTRPIPINKKRDIGRSKKTDGHLKSPPPPPEYAHMRAATDLVRVPCSRAWAHAMVRDPRLRENVAATTADDDDDGEESSGSGGLPEMVSVPFKSTAIRTMTRSDGR